MKSYVTCILFIQLLRKLWNLVQFLSFCPCRIEACLIIKSFIIKWINEWYLKTLSFYWQLEKHTVVYNFAMIMTFPNNNMSNNLLCLYFIVIFQNMYQKHVAFTVNIIDFVELVNACTCIWYWFISMIVYFFVHGRGSHCFFSAMGGADGEGLCSWPVCFWLVAFGGALCSWPVCFWLVAFGGALCSWPVCFWLVEFGGALCSWPVCFWVAACGAPPDAATGR